MGEAAFFQIAATLIPVLTFTGVLVVRPPAQRHAWKKPLTPWELVQAAALFVFGIVAVTAETVAISGAMSGHGSVLDRYLIIYTLLIGMWALVLRGSLPVFIRAARETESRKGGKSGRRDRWWLISIALLTVGGIVLSAEALSTSVRAGEAVARSDLATKLTNRYAALTDEIDRDERRYRAISIRIAALEAKRPLTEAERLNLRFLRTEQDSAFASEKLDWLRQRQLQDKLVDLLANPVPP